MPAAPKPAAAPAAAPETALPAEAVTLKPGKHKPPLSMSQQRFLLTLIALVALLGSLYEAATMKDMVADVRTAVLTIISTALVGTVRDAFKHYFPGGQADQPTPPAK